MQDKEIKAGVVLVTRYTTPSNSSYQSYIDYMARDKASRQANAPKYVFPALIKDMSYAGYSFDYMGDASKTTDLFSDELDTIDQDDMAALKKAFNAAQKNGSPMWQSIISFDNAFLAQYGIYDPESQTLDENRIRHLTRICMRRMLQKEELYRSAVYTASIHYNTDNIHVHIATVEPVPTRPLATIKTITFPREFTMKHNLLSGIENESHLKFGRSIKVTTYKGGYNQIYSRLVDTLQKENLALNLGNYITVNPDLSITMTYRGSKDQLPKDVTYSEQTAVKGKFSKKSIEAGKSGIVNEIVKQKESLSEINHILRQTMLGQMKKSAFRTDPELSSAFVSLLHLLPSDFEKLDYGSKKMAEYRPQIDKITNLWLDTYYKKEFSEVKTRLSKIDEIYKQAYGQNTERSYSEGKIRDFYSRCGNRILFIARNGLYNKINTLHKHDTSSALESSAYTALTAKHDIETGLYFLKRSLESEYEHLKNQALYKHIILEQNNDFGRE